VEAEEGGFGLASDALCRTAKTSSSWYAYQTATRRVSACQQRCAVLCAQPWCICICITHAGEGAGGTLLVAVSTYSGLLGSSPQPVRSFGGQTWRGVKQEDPKRSNSQPLPSARKPALSMI